MTSTVSELLNLLFRTLHVVAGVMLVGQLWFLILVKRQMAAAYDPDTRRKTMPEVAAAFLLMRWSAVLAWASGFALLGLIYYAGGALTSPDQSRGVAHLAGLTTLIVPWFAYDAMWTRLTARHASALAISILLLTAIAVLLAQVMTGRALFIHVGAMLATVMVLNLWLRIWPSQRAIAAAMQAGTPPRADAAALAAQRSMHNLYLSVPVLLFMISNHYPGAYGSRLAWLVALGFVAAGWWIARHLCKLPIAPA